MFVPDDFEPPTSPAGEVFRLEPLGPYHNERDHREWMSSIERIRRSPGLADWPWPHMMTLDEDAGDLVADDEDFVAQRGFTCTVLDADDDVIGWVYIYADEDGGYGAPCTHGSARTVPTSTRWSGRPSWIGCAPSGPFADIRGTQVSSRSREGYSCEPDNWPSARSSGIVASGASAKAVSWASRAALMKNRSVVCSTRTSTTPSPSWSTR